MNIKILLFFSIFIVTGAAQHEKVQYLLIKEDGPPTQDETFLAPECFEMPSETGRCRAIALSFRYIIESNECEQFTYGGCGATPNFFRTAKDCVDKCGGEVKIPLKRRKTKRSKKVKRAFRTLIRSAEDERDYKTSTDLRPYPIPLECEAKATEIGMCRAMLIRFRFIKETMQCQQFVYGGCGATENIFGSGDECNQKCGGRIQLMSRNIK